MRTLIRLLSLLNRAGALVGLRRADRDLDEEIAFHVDARAAEFMAAGMPEADARAAARQAFGNLALTAEDSRAAWRYLALDSIVQDVRFGVRALRRTPIFTVAVVTTLALGIGANTAIFTLIDRIMLRSLAVGDPDRLVAFGARPLMGLRQSDGPPDRNAILFSVPLFRDFARHTDVFTGLAAVGSYPVTAYLGAGTVAAGDRLEQATALLVSGDLFRVLGAPLQAGRGLTPGDDTPGAASPAVVLGHGLWMRRFGGDPGVIGRTLRASGTDYTVVGVAAPALRGLSLGIDADLWIPLSMQPRLMRGESFLDQRDFMWGRLVGRLAPGVTAEQAEARTNDLFRQLVTEEAGTTVTPETRSAIARLTTELVPFARGFSNMRERWGLPLMTLMAVVGLVLLIACANVGNLLLARASSRQRELSLRVALGAGRGRLVRQLLTESVMLSVMGGAMGLLVADWAVRFLLGVLTAQGAAAIDTSVDGPVLMFAAAVTALSALFFGLLPAVRAARTDVNVALRRSSPTGTGDRRGWRLRRALVVFQVAVSLCLLVGAGLLLRSLGNLKAQDYGFRAESVLVAEIDPQGGGIGIPQLPSLYRSLLDRLEALPGVSSASLSLYGLLSRAQRNEVASVDGHAAPDGEETVVRVLFATPRYFDTVGAVMTSGRVFDDRDRDGGPLVAIVSEAFARHVFGDRPAVGRRFGLEGPESSRQIEIVGTVRNIKPSDPREDAPLLIYRPAAQVAEYLNSIEVRATGDPRRLVPALRRTVAEAAPQLPVLDVSLLSAQVDYALRQERVLGQLTALFGALAAALAAVGLHGVLAFGVAQRTSELGIRLALGASRQQVLWMVLRQALGWVAAGATLGLVGALPLGRLMAALLFGVEPIDPATILAAAATLVIVASVAAYWPARRAARLDPLTALRFE